ncbi:MAG: hypothetical protein ACLQIB_26060 [Isosphaeraceae bacterium]
MSQEKVAVLRKPDHVANEEDAIRKGQDEWEERLPLFQFAEVETAAYCLVKCHDADSGATIALVEGDY